MGFGSMLGTTLGHRAGQAIADGLSGKKDASKLQREELDHQKEMAEEEAKRDDLTFITNLKLGETATEISEALNMLFSKAALLPTGFAALGDSNTKQKKKALIEKMEFGIMKLNKLDPDSAVFFQRKFDVFTKKKG